MNPGVYSLLTYLEKPRLNYILWIQDLLDSTGGGRTDAYDPSRKIIGLDMYYTSAQPPRSSLANNRV